MVASTARPRRTVSSTLASKFAILAFMLIALLCFLPSSSLVSAEEEKKENVFGTVIGIDLGTTYSCVA
jgi:heat shock protein 5